MVFQSIATSTSFSAHHTNILQNDFSITDDSFMVSHFVHSTYLPWSWLWWLLW